MYMYDIHSPHTKGDRRGERWRLRRGISIHSCEGRQQQNDEGAVEQEFQSAPLMRGETVGDVEHAHRVAISIHSPHTRGDSISLQKSIRIYVSLHNKTMIHRFSELYKPLFAAQNPIFGVRSPWEIHDSFTFARLSEGPGITP